MRLNEVAGPAPHVPSAVKFLLLNAIAFSLLFASYHYVARSTWIGRMLNGHAHPFVAWPFGKNVP